MPFILLASLITLRRIDTLRGYLEDKRKSSYDFMFPKGKSDYFSVYKQGCMICVRCLRDGLLFSDIAYYYK